MLKSFVSSKICDINWWSTFFKAYYIGVYSQARTYWRGALLPDVTTPTFGDWPHPHRNHFRGGGGVEQPANRPPSLTRQHGRTDKSAALVKTSDDRAPHCTWRGALPDVTTATFGDWPHPHTCQRHLMIGPSHNLCMVGAQMPHAWCLSWNLQIYLSWKSK